MGGNSQNLSGNMVAGNGQNLNIVADNGQNLE